jgi:hypothetical protein
VLVKDVRMTQWPVEEIPDEHSLLMRVHKGHIKPDGSLGPGAFKNRGDGMSTDWDRYSTPEETLHRAKNPKENGVIEMMVGKVRTVPEQKVEHTPMTENRAHTDVFGEKNKDPEVRTQLRRISQWVVHYGS